jgi:predicted RNase H-like nuclease (RuvC/YqgF family)
MIDLEKIEALANAAGPDDPWYKPGDLRYVDDKNGEMHGLDHRTDDFIASTTPAAVLEMIDRYKSARDRKNSITALKAENADLKTGYEAYERVNAELRAECGILKSQVQALQGEPSSYQTGFDAGRKSSAAHADNWRREASKVDKLRAECEALRVSLRAFTGSCYPVSKSIDERGYRWSEAYLDQALEISKEAAQ